MVEGAALGVIGEAVALFWLRPPLARLSWHGLLWSCGGYGCRSGVFVGAHRFVASEGFLYGPAQLHELFGRRAFELLDVGLNAQAAMPVVAFVEAHTNMVGDPLAGVLRAFFIPPFPPGG